jgi:hypothetical protein
MTFGVFDVPALWDYSDQYRLRQSIEPGLGVGSADAVTLETNFQRLRVSLRWPLSRKDCLRYPRCTIELHTPWCSLCY